MTGAVGCIMNVRGYQHWNTANTTQGIYLLFENGHKSAQTRCEVCSNLKKWTSAADVRLTTVFFINPIQDEGRRVRKAPLSVFSHVTSTNIGISSHNFLTFSLNPFATLVGNFKFEPRPPIRKSGFTGQILIKLRLW